MTAFERIQAIRAELLARLEDVNMGRRGHLLQRWLIEKRTKCHIAGDAEGVSAVRYLQEFYIPEYDWSEDPDRD